MVNRFFLRVTVFIVVISGAVSIFAKIQQPLNWQPVESKSKNTVVQVFAQFTQFNWLEPYKTPHQSQGCGTAFFIDQEGHLLTNFHVVNQAKSVQLKIPALGSQLLDASIIGCCPELDVALLKLNSRGINDIKKVLGKIPYLNLGDSDKLYCPQEVLALGYPLGFRYLKGTVGVIAGREFIHSMSYMHITAPINPGNSGGPLLNMSGQVVGINTAGLPKVQEEGKDITLQNIGYIIPINDIKTYLPSIKSKKLVRKPVFGITYNNSTDELALSLKNPLPTGVYINDVLKGSVADKLGIKVGDMLYKINGSTVDQYGDVTVQWRNAERVSIEEFLIRLPIEAPLTLTIYRKGKKIELKGLFSERTLQPIRYVYPDFEPEAIDYEMLGGMCVQMLRLNHFKDLPQTPLLQEYYKEEHHDKEVLVITKILPGSYISKINCLYESAFIDEINGITVKNLKDFRIALEESLTSGLVSIKTKDKIYTVISLDTLLKDEGRISKDFVFTPTPMTRYLQKARRNSKVIKRQIKQNNARPTDR